VSDQERRLENLQNNPGAWGISDYQDEQFIKSYLQDAKENFGDKLEGNLNNNGNNFNNNNNQKTRGSGNSRAKLQAQGAIKHVSDTASVGAGDGIISLLERRLGRAEAAKEEEKFVDSPFAGFIRVPHLPSTWYTAETHEPISKVSIWAHGFR
jgi:hypothetical protein